MPKVSEAGKKRDYGLPYWQSKDQSILLYHTDCISWMDRVYEPFVDLVFADPPFNIGHKYDECKDTMTSDQYIQWTINWLCRAYRCLKPTGCIYVCSGSKYQADIKKIMDDVGFHWQNTIIWHYTFGPAQKVKFTPSWVAIHYATMSKKTWTWNQPAVKIPSARQLKYGDRRASKGGKTPDNVWILDPSQYEECFQFHQDVMLESRVCGTFKDRTGHPCQMPVPILERILKASTNEGDMVLDPFLGSGTTAAACKTLKRKCVGLELSQQYLDRDAIPRLEKE